MCYQFKNCGILVPTNRRLGCSSHDALALVFNGLRLQPLRPDFRTARHIRFRFILTFQLHVTDVKTQILTVPFQEAYLKQCVVIAHLPMVAVGPLNCLLATRSFC